MDNQLWSWVLTIVGVICFWLAGRKIWWAWYVGIAGQILWVTYSFITIQWGFIIGAFLYTFIYARNSYRWTKEHFEEKIDE